MMKVAIEISPLENDSPHFVRGSGFYLRHLVEAIEADKSVSLTKFMRSNGIPFDDGVIHYPYFEPFFLTLPYKKPRRLVVTVHDLTPVVFSEHFPVGVKGIIKWQIQKRLLKRADAIITDSVSSKKDIVKILGVQDKIVSAIPLAAGNHFKKISLTSQEVVRLRKRYHLPEKFVLYVGDVTWNKNLPRLLSAVKEAKVPLVMVGKALIEKDFDRNNPWNRDRITAVEMAKHANVTLLGFVPDNDLVALYNLAVAFVMPSLYEGFGLPVLEAMGCGAPVVTSREGSLSEVAGDAAYYVNAYSVQSIAEGIKKVFSDDKLRYTLSVKGNEHARKFSWINTAAQTIAVYKKLIHEQRAHSRKSVT